MCNINTAEVAYRKRAMWFGIIVSASLLTVFLLFPIPAILRISLFLPIYVAAIGYLQVKNKFCVAYGSSGKQNAQEGSVDAKDVLSVDAKSADKKKSLQMNKQAFVLSFALTILVLLIPGL